MEATNTLLSRNKLLSRVEEEMARTAQVTSPRLSMAVPMQGLERVFWLLF